MTNNFTPSDRITLQTCITPNVWRRIEKIADPATYPVEEDDAPDSILLPATYPKGYSDAEAVIKTAIAIGHALGKDIKQFTQGYMREDITPILKQLRDAGIEFVYTAESNRGFSVTFTQEQAKQLYEVYKNEILKPAPEQEPALPKYLLSRGQKESLRKLFNPSTMPFILHPSGLLLQPNTQPGQDASAIEAITGDLLLQSLNIIGGALKDTGLLPIDRTRKGTITPLPRYCVSPKNATAIKNIIHDLRDTVQPDSKENRASNTELINAAFDNVVFFAEAELNAYAQGRLSRSRR